jgi:hypothetical protein
VNDVFRAIEIKYIILSKMDYHLNNLVYKIESSVIKLISGYYKITTSVEQSNMYLQIREYDKDMKILITSTLRMFMDCEMYIYRYTSPSRLFKACPSAKYIIVSAVDEKKTEVDDTHPHCYIDVCML